MLEIHTEVYFGNICYKQEEKKFFFSTNLLINLRTILQYSFHCKIIVTVPLWDMLLYVVSAFLFLMIISKFACKKVKIFESFLKKKQTLVPLPAKISTTESNLRSRNSIVNRFERFPLLFVLWRNSRCRYITLWRQNSVYIFHWWPLHTKISKWLVNNLDTL